MNDEIRMTEGRKASIHNSFVIRHLSFVIRICATVVLVVAVAGFSRGETIESDICIYGGTAAGVAAGVQATRMGKSAIIAEFGNHVGGMTSGGLGATDIGNKAAIGGISREFYRRVALHYARDDAWRCETREDYFNHRSARPAATNSASGTRGSSSFRQIEQNLSAADATMWTFEPHVAEDIFFQMLNEANVPIYFQQRLTSVEKKANRITEIRMENGKVYR